MTEPEQPAWHYIPETEEMWFGLLEHDDEPVDAVPIEEEKT